MILSTQVSKVRERLPELVVKKSKQESVYHSHIDSQR